jgi:diguanylate cyclase (GGDEF)-like protein
VSGFAEGCAPLSEVFHQLIHPLWLLVAAAFGAGLGALLGRWGRTALIEETDRLAAELARSEAQGRDQTRQTAKLRNEQRALSNLTRLLPNIARDLNRSDLDERQIPRFVFNLADAIFEPEQVLLYLVRASAGSDRGPSLQLVDRTGSAEVPPSAVRVKIGEGKIGWVAEAKVEMLADDWLNSTRTEGRTIEDNHPSLRLDYIGPLVQHHEGKDQLLGVLCIGGPATRPRDEKLMLQMVTNLASIAYTNSRNMRALRDLANHDGLTGLLNKRYFMSQRLGLLINAAERDGQSLSVFIFDIDHFKKYNDTNGHLAGDEILKGVANVLRDNLRPSDIACRYGGEEFIVAMPGTRGADGLAASERIRAAIERTKFPRSETQPLGAVTISGGTAQFPVDGTNSNDLILHADQALYQAKAAGRNRIVQYRGVDIGSDPGDDPVVLPRGQSGDAS